MLIVAAGSLFVTGLLCTWIALQYLVQFDVPVQRPMPTIVDEGEKEPEVKLTRLGRPIEVRRLK